MDALHPRVSAIAIRGDRVIAVGSDDEIKATIGPKTKVIDLHGRSATPGLVDAHAHLYELGQTMEAVDLRGAASAKEAAARVGAIVSTRAAGEWLLGRGWDQNRWEPKQFPDRSVLDAAVGDRPALLERVDGHAVWVSSAALRAAGIDRETKDPDGGKILRDAGGEPTGVLVDNAVELVVAKIPAASPEVIERRIRAAAAVAISGGLTGVHEMGIPDDVAAVYRSLDAKHALPLRVYAYRRGDPAHASLLREDHPQPPGDRFEMRGVKFYVDGALGSRGARLTDDYADDPGNRGLWVTPPDVLAKAVDDAVAGGWQVAIHAIGDAAVGSVIDAYIAANAKYTGDHRLRIEHLQILAPDDLKRLIESRAIASMQPTHATSDMPWAEKRIGADRIKGAYAWRTMLDNGVPVAAGSDFPVEEVSPLLGIYSAVTRQDATGMPAGGWYPGQRMTLDEAIAAFTRGAAYAEGAEALRGMIAPGRDADLTVYDRKLAPDHSLLTTKIAYTIVGGTIAFQAGGAR